MQGTCPNPGECQREEEGAKGQAFPKAAGRGSGLVPAACRRSSVGRLGVVRYQERKTAGFMALCHPYPVPAFAFRCCSVGVRSNSLRSAGRAGDSTRRASP